MSTKLIRIAVVAGLFFTACLHAQDTKSTEALEAKFKEAMTAVTMEGRWYGLKDGVMGPEKQDRYNIVGVEKGSGDSWTIKVRLSYGKLDFVAPLPIQVKWAGDTAVLVVDQMLFPGPGGQGGNKYSARVLIYDNTYAGTWSGGGHGGLLSGVITKTKEAGK